MKDEKEVRKILKLNTHSLGVQLDILTELTNTQSQHSEVMHLQNLTIGILVEELKRLRDLVEGLEKKREWVN